MSSRPPTSRAHYLTRNIRILSFVSLFTDIASEMLFPFTPIFLAQIGYGAFFIGFLEGFTELVAGLSKGYFGQLSDQRARRRPFVQIGYALSTLAKPLIWFSTAPFWIFNSRFLDRLGKGVRSNARDAWLADESLTEHRGKVFGFHRAMDTLGAIIGPLLALLYLNFYPGDYRSLFLIALAPGAIALTLTFITREKPIHQETETTRLRFFSFLGYWKHASLSYKTVVLFFLLFGLLNSSSALLILFARQALNSDTAVIVAYIMYNVFFALFAFPMGHLADRWGMKKTWILGLLFFAGAFLGLTRVQNMGSLIFIFFIYAIYSAATESISKAWLTKLAPQSERALALGFFTAFQSVCLLIASSWTGWLWSHKGAELPFLLSGLGALVIAVFAWKFLKEPLHNDASTQANSTL